MILGNYNALWLLFVVPAVIVPVYIYCFIVKRRTLRIFAQADLLAKINPRHSLQRQIAKAIVLTVAFLIIVIAITEPKWNKRTRQIKRRGRDVAVLLDVSHSMLAEDITPNRLEKSKLAIKDLIETLAGDRVAIVTFAGNSTIKCPMTSDYAFARMALENVSTESTSKGGTMIGDALRKTADELFADNQDRYKDIVLITDGNDHGSFPIEAAAKCSKKGIRIIAIGLGSEDEGARIPVMDSAGNKSFLKYNGQEVWVKLDSDSLRQIAAASADGKYLQVGPGTAFNLDQIYQQIIASAAKHQLEETAVTEYDEKFQIFIALAIILIFGEVFISECKKI